MRIYLKPRIHVTLISMHDSGYRVNGGIGFTIEEPKGVCSFRQSANFNLTDRRKTPLNAAEIAQIKEMLEIVRREYNIRLHLDIDINDNLLSHYGMGAGTGIKLACLEALFSINNIAYDQDLLVKYSGRGGASGVGINTYFHGGLVVDLGRKNVGDSFRPSSTNTNPAVPLLLNRVEMPDWPIGICIPSNLAPKTREEEIAFFERICPLTEADSYQTAYHSLFGLLASAMEADKETFSASLKALQECKWKKAERKEYGAKLAELEKQLYNAGATSVGMSSLGPMLFFVSNIDLRTVQEQMEGTDCDILFTRPSNTGREIEMSGC